MTPYAQKLLDKHTAAATMKTGAQGGRAVPALASPAIPAALAVFPVNMTVNEVASYFAISADAVLAFRDSGQLDFINVAPGANRPTWRITRASVAALEAKRTILPVGQCARMEVEGVPVQ